MAFPQQGNSDYVADSVSVDLIIQPQRGILFSIVQLKIIVKQIGMVFALCKFPQGRISLIEVFLLLLPNFASETSFKWMHISIHLHDFQLLVVRE